MLGNTRGKSKKDIEYWDPWGPLDKKGLGNGF